MERLSLIAIQPRDVPPRLSLRRLASQLCDVPSFKSVAPTSSFLPPLSSCRASSGSRTHSPHARSAQRRPCNGHRPARSAQSSSRVSSLSALGASLVLPRSSGGSADRRLTAGRNHYSTSHNPHSLFPLSSLPPPVPFSPVPCTSRATLDALSPLPNPHDPLHPPHSSLPDLNQKNAPLLFLPPQVRSQPPRFRQSRAASSPSLLLDVNSESCERPSRSAASVEGLQEQVCEQDGGEKAREGEAGAPAASDAVEDDDWWG